MSIIGESFRQFVSTQIFQRQTLYGKKTRSAEDLTLLTNSNAWLKLASSVRVIPLTETETEEGANESKPVLNIDTGIYEDSNISSGEQRLRDIGLPDTGKFTGNQLARKAVLFNTLTQVNPTKKSNDLSKKDTPGSKVFRKGVISTSTSNLWNNNSY